MARFMIHWCAPDPTSQEYTQAIVNYIKGGKSMDEFAGFAVLARQIHPQPMVACCWWKPTTWRLCRSTLIPGPRGWASRQRLLPASAMKSMSSWKRA